MYFLYGGAPWEILVVKLIFWYYVRQLALKRYMNIYTTTRKSRGGVPLWHYVFQCNTECKWYFYKILSLFLQGEGGTMRNSRGEIDNLVQCQLFVLNLYLQGCLPPRENLMVGCPFYSTTWSNISKHKNRTNLSIDQIVRKNNKIYTT